MSIKRGWWHERVLCAGFLYFFRLFMPIGTVFILLGCSTFHPISYDATSRATCDTPPQTAVNGHFPLKQHLPLPPQALEDKLQYEPFTIIEAHSNAHGSTSSMNLMIQFNDCSVMKVKWRAAPPKGDAYNNNPRKELAAYAIQKLFLDPQDYMVPVTVAVCIPYEEIAKIGSRATPQIDGASCVIGTLSSWLKNVKGIDHVIDKERFERSVAGEDGGGHARSFAHLNLFTYLISHRDGRKSNFLVSDHPQSHSLFAVDNGLSFSGLGNPFPWVPRWAKLKVDKLPQATMIRLRSLQSDRLYRHLETVAEFSIAPDGTVRPMADFSENIDPQEGVRLNSHALQFGLRQEEIEHIEQRMQKLFKRLDTNEIQLFSSR